MTRQPILLREAATKKSLLLMAGLLRTNPPPPSSLMAVEILERWKKRDKNQDRISKIIYVRFALYVYMYISYVP